MSVLFKKMENQFVFAKIYLLSFGLELGEE